MPCGFLRFRLFLGHRDGSVCVCQQKRCRERPHQKAKPPDPIAALRYAGKTCGRMGQGRARPHGVRMRGKMQGACLPWAWAGGDRRASFHKGIQKSGSVSGCRSAVVWLWSGLGGSGDVLLLVQGCGHPAGNEEPDQGKDVYNAERRQSVLLDGQEQVREKHKRHNDAR